MKLREVVSLVVAVYLVGNGFRIHFIPDPSVKDINEIRIATTGVINPDPNAPVGYFFQIPNGWAWEWDTVPFNGWTYQGSTLIGSGTVIQCDCGTWSREPCTTQIKYISKEPILD